jgi:hypothetical protein
MSPRRHGRAALASAHDPAEHTSSAQAGNPSEASRRLGPATDREAATRPGETGPTVTAALADGPLEGKSIEAEVVEGRPPKIIDVPADDGSLCRYCLADWVQAGSSAVYTFLYRV